MTSKFICFIGIDGSGKSTLIKNVMDTLGVKNTVSHYAHMYHQPLLLHPIKKIAQRYFLNGKQQFDGDYSEYSRIKKSQSNRFRIFAGLYATLWVIDFSLQLIFRLLISKYYSRSDFFFADRYIYDTAINIILSLGFDYDFCIKLIRYWLRIFPIPDVVFWIDIPVEIAFSRKDDIPSIEYLSDRKAIYSKLAMNFNFINLDGQATSSDICSKVINYLQGEEN